MICDGIHHCTLRW